MAGYFENMVMRRFAKLQANANAAADQAAREVGKAADQYAFESVLPELEDELKLAYWNATSAWYRAYIPKMYSRSHSFYNALDIKQPESMAFGWEYKADDMVKPSWNGGSYNVYGRVFLGGAHGGPVRGRAPAQSTPIPDLLDELTPEIQSMIQWKIDLLGQEYFESHFKERCSELLRNMP